MSHRIQKAKANWQRKTRMLAITIFFSLFNLCVFSFAIFRFLKCIWTHLLLFAGAAALMRFIMTRNQHSVYLILSFFSLCLHAAHMSGCIFIVECKQLLITYTGANVSTACCMHIAQHTARDHGVLCTRCTVLNKRVHGAHEKLLRGKNYICSYTLDFIW